jgi:hypothetical protein
VSENGSAVGHVDFVGGHRAARAGSPRAGKPGPVDVKSRELRVGAGERNSQRTADTGRGTHDDATRP